MPLFLFRTGKYFGIEHFDGVRPDIMVFAKAIASGFPLSGLAASAELHKHWQPGTTTTKERATDEKIACNAHPQKSQSLLTIVMCVSIIIIKHRLPRRNIWRKRSGLRCCCGHPTGHQGREIGGKRSCERQAAHQRSSQT